MFWPTARPRRLDAEVEKRLALARRNNPESETWLTLVEAALAETADVGRWRAAIPAPAEGRPARAPLLHGTEIAVDGRAVRRFVFQQGVEMPERGMAPVLQIGRMSVPAAVETEWNAWYSNEYIPGYRKVPGVIYARRYRVHEGTSGYTTVYEFASTAVPDSAEWKEQQQQSSPHSPRMRQAMTHAPGSAGVYTRIDP